MQQHNGTPILIHTHMQQHYIELRLNFKQNKMVHPKWYPILIPIPLTTPHTYTLNALYLAKPKFQTKWYTHTHNPYIHTYNHAAAQWYTHTHIPIHTHMQQHYIELNKMVHPKCYTHTNTYTLNHHSCIYS